MSTTTSKDFEHYYGVTLLPYSTESTQIGELMYKRGFFVRTLEYSNETILDVLNLEQQERQTIESELKNPHQLYQ